MIDLVLIEDDLFAYGCMGLLVAFMATAIGCTSTEPRNLSDRIALYLIMWLWASSPIALILAWWI